MLTLPSWTGDGTVCLFKTVCLSVYLVDVYVVVFRYFEHLVTIKQQGGKGLLTWNQLQEEVTSVNVSVEDEHQRTDTRQTFIQFRLASF